jgi:hypothetical protein
MRTSWSLSLCIVLFSYIGVIGGWGYDTHRRINHTAATLLTGDFGIYILQIQDSLAIHAPDPDYWKADDPNEGYRHYMDADYYDSFPFDEIPRDFDRLIQTYGDSSVNEWGIGPWTIKNSCETVSELMKVGDWDAVPIYLAALGHYVSDLHMPLHVVANYNGQFSGNEGIHFRWEVSMTETYLKDIQSEDDIVYIADPVEFAFEIIKESYQVHTILLHADSLARAPLSMTQRDSLKTLEALSFEMPYLEILFNETENILTDRTNKAVSRVASYWYTCWVNAGYPALPHQ